MRCYFSNKQKPQHVEDCLQHFGLTKPTQVYFNTNEHVLIIYSRLMAKVGISALLLVYIRHIDVLISFFVVVFQTGQVSKAAQGLGLGLGYSVAPTSALC